MRSKPRSHRHRDPSPGAERAARRYGPGSALALAVTILSGSCTPSSVQMQQTVICFIEAVQDQDGARWLGCAGDDLARSALGQASGGSPEERRRAATGRLQAVARDFIEQRKRGVIDLSGSDGLLLVHFLSLGRGAYYLFGEPRLEEERTLLRMEVRLFYRLIDYPRHRKKLETFWRLGRPLGTIYPIISGMTQMGLREELSRVEIDWVLEQSPSGGWRVREVRLQPETSVYSVVGS